MMRIEKMGVKWLMFLIYNQDKAALSNNQSNFLRSLLKGSNSSRLKMADITSRRKILRNLFKIIPQTEHKKRNLLKGQEKLYHKSPHQNRRKSKLKILRNLSLSW
jgi:hypothetical protein